MNWSPEPYWEVFEAPPAPTLDPGKSHSGAKGDGKREYYRQRSREAKALARQDKRLFQWSAGRARSLAKRFGVDGAVDEWFG
jgi:hypothetical protein